MQDLVIEVETEPPCVCCGNAYSAHRDGDEACPPFPEAGVEAGIYKSPEVWMAEREAALTAETKPLLERMRWHLADLHGWQVVTDASCTHRAIAGCDCPVAKDFREVKRLLKEM